LKFSNNDINIYLILIYEKKRTILVYSYFGSFILYLQNKDIKDDKQYICTKSAFAIRNYNDPSKYKAFRNISIPIISQYLIL